MLKVIEQTPSRMVLQDKRPISVFVAASFTLLNVCFVLVLGYTAVDILIFSEPKDLMAWRYFGATVFILVGVGLTVIGLLVTLHFLHGVTVVFDKQAEEVRLESTHYFRAVQMTYPIYGVSRLDIETNNEMRSYGLFLVLRSGERIALTSFAMLDEEDMRRTVEQMRAHLRTVGGWGNSPA